MKFIFDYRVKINKLIKFDEEKNEYFLDEYFSYGYFLKWYISTKFDMKKIAIVSITEDEKCVARECYFNEIEFDDDHQLVELMSDSNMFLGII